MRAVILFRIILIAVASAYSAVVSPYANHFPSQGMLALIAGYAVIGLLPPVWASLRGAQKWLRVGPGLVLLRVTFAVDALFLLILAYGKGNDLWAAFFIPWGMVLVVSSRTRVSLQMLDTVLGLVLAAMIALTVWLAISSAVLSPVANALVLWGAFLEGWVVLRCLVQERNDWADTISRDSREVESLRLMTGTISTSLVLVEEGKVVAKTGPDFLQLKIGEHLGRSGMPKEIIERLQDESFSEEGPVELECQGKDPSGNKVYVGISAFPLDKQNRNRMVLTLESRKSSVLRQERINRSNRLASVGQLAAGVAHELGNPIAIIKSCAGYLIDRAKKEESEVEELDIIQREAARCEDLLSRLKSLASTKEEPESLDMRSAVQEAISLVRYQTKDIRLDLSMPREGVPVVADQSQMVAVLVNLLMNAVQSMEGRPKEPGIQVSLEQREKRAVLRVVDHGRGMTSEEQDKIFDPFYTGRPDGTGLGLSIIHQVVESLGATIEVESEIDKGTTFIITIPMSDEHAVG